MLRNLFAAANFTYVSLKLVRTEDSRIVRGHDYALPNDRDVQRLLQVPSLTLVKIVKFEPT